MEALGVSVCADGNIVKGNEDWLLLNRTSTWRWSYKIRPRDPTQQINVLLRSVEEIMHYSALPTSLHVILVETGSRRMTAQMLALGLKPFSVNYSERGGGGRLMFSLQRLCYRLQCGICHRFE